MDFFFPKSCEKVQQLLSSSSLPCIQPFLLWELKEIHLVSLILCEDSKYFYFHFIISKTGLGEDK